MESRLGKRGSPDERENREESVHSRRGRGRGRGRRMRGGGRFVEEELVRSATRRTESSGSDRVLQCSEEATVTMRMRSTDSERLSRRLEDEFGNNAPSLSTEEAADRVVELTAEKDELVVRVNDYKVARENLERKLSEQDVILKAMTASVKNLEKTVSSLEEENRLLKKTNEELTATYGGQKTVVGKSVEKLVKSVPTRFVGMAMCISRAIPKWCAREICELDYFSAYLRRNWTGRSERSSEGGIDNGEGELVVPLDPFGLVGVGIFKRSFSSESTVLIALAEAHFESAEWAASFEKEATKEEVLSEVCNNGVLRARLRQCLSDACSSAKRKARDELFQQVGYQRLVSRFAVSSDVDLKEKKEEIRQAQEKLLKTVEGSDELDMSWWRTCTDVSLLQFKSTGCEEEDEIGEREGIYLQSGVSAAADTGADDVGETLALFRNETAKQVFKEFLGYDPKREDGSYVHGTIMSIARLDAWVATVVLCLVEREKRGGQRQKEYADTFGRMLETATKQVIGNIGEFVKHWSWDEVTVEEDGQSSEERRGSVMSMSRTATRVWTLPSVGKTFISVDERWFRTYVTDAVGSVTDCYIAEVLNDGQIDILGAPTKKYEADEDVE